MVSTTIWKKITGLAILDVTLTRAMSHYLWLAGNSNISTWNTKKQQFKIKRAKASYGGWEMQKWGEMSTQKSCLWCELYASGVKLNFENFFVMWILKDAHHEEGIESLGTWQQKISKVLLRVLDRRSIRSAYYDKNLKTVCIFIFCLNRLIFWCVYGTKRYNQFGTSVSVDRLWETVKYRSIIQWHPLVQ